MPMPRWFATLNKHTFNKRELAKGTRPVLTHTGRSTGATYRTPLDAHEVDDGFLFILVYGSESDWVQNILASGSASLSIDGTTIDLRSPRVVGSDEAWARLPDETKRPAGFLNIDEFLVMERAA